MGKPKRSTRPSAASTRAAKSRTTRSEAAAAPAARRARAASNAAKPAGARTSPGGARRAPGEGAKRARAPGRGAERLGPRGPDLAPYTAHLGRAAGAERPSLPVRVLLLEADRLRKAAEAHAAVFALDRRLPKKAPERARKLADELRHVDLDDGGSMRARNLAASALDFVLTEVRAAARYLFADEPRVLAPFLSRYETLRKARTRSRRKAKGPAGAPSPTPEEA